MNLGKIVYEGVRRTLRTPLCTCLITIPTSLLAVVGIVPKKRNRLDICETGALNLLNYPHEFRLM